PLDALKDRAQLTLGKWDSVPSVPFPQPAPARRLPEFLRQAPEDAADDRVGRGVASSFADASESRSPRPVSRLRPDGRRTWSGWCVSRRSVEHFPGIERAAHRLKVVGRDGLGVVQQQPAEEGAPWVLE